MRQDRYLEKRLDSLFRKAFRKDEKSYCYYCYNQLTYNNKTVDHKKPKSKGGLNTVDNYVIACYDCNQKKGSQSESLFKKRIKNIETGYECIYLRRKINIAVDKSLNRMSKFFGIERTDSCIF